ncbi:Uncharacterized protein APZ42_004861, partial [Daphnia magna]
LRTVRGRKIFSNTLVFSAIIAFHLIYSGSIPYRAFFLRESILHFI